MQYAAQSMPERTWGRGMRLLGKGELLQLLLLQRCADNLRAQAPLPLSSLTPAC